MLILVAVTVQIAVDSGLFGHAQDATSGYGDRQAQEQSIGDGNFNIVINGVTYNSLDEFREVNPGAEIPGTGDTEEPEEPTYTADRSILSVGDYIDYKPDTASTYAYPLSSAVTGSTSNGSTYPQEETALKWRIMSINDDGSVDLISATPTSTYLYFRGASGYNNGVYVLNDLCEKMYSNSTLGVTARSIDLIDIESKMNGEGIASRNAYTYTSGSYSKKYGGTDTYADKYSYAPDAWDGTAITAEEESTDVYTVPTTNTYEQKGAITVTQTYYSVTFNSTHFDNTTFHELIFGTGSYYWLASRYTLCTSTYAYFGLRYVSSSNLGGFYMFDSGNYAYNPYRFVRPVVTLGSNIQISTEGGTAESPRAISVSVGN